MCPFSKTYLKNSLECTALEVRKYQTGFLGLLRMVWRVVFPLASWKISKRGFFSTRFMEKEQVFPSHLHRYTTLEPSLKNGCLGFNFLSCPSVTKCTSFFFSPLLTAFSLAKLPLSFLYRPFEAYLELVKTIRVVILCQLQVLPEKFKKAIFQGLQLPNLNFPPKYFHLYFKNHQSHNENLPQIHTTLNLM